MPEEFRERVFDKFFRVEYYRSGTEGGARGSGIGLYMAREIVEAHGGSMACGEAPARGGAAFVVVLPVDGVEVAPVGR